MSNLLFTVIGIALAAVLAMVAMQSTDYSTVYADKWADEAVLGMEQLEAGYLEYFENNAARPPENGTHGLDELIPLHAWLPKRNHGFEWSYVNDAGDNDYFCLSLQAGQSATKAQARTIANLNRRMSADKLVIGASCGLEAINEDDSVTVAGATNLAATYWTNPGDAAAAAGGPGPGPGPGPGGTSGGGGGEYFKAQVQDIDHINGLVAGWNTVNFDKWVEMEDNIGVDTTQDGFMTVPPGTYKWYAEAGSTNVGYSSCTLGLDGTQLWDGISIESTGSATRCSGQFTVSQDTVVTLMFWGESSGSFGRCVNAGSRKPGPGDAYCSLGSVELVRGGGSADSSSGGSSATGSNMVYHTQYRITTSLGDSTLNSDWYVPSVNPWVEVHNSLGATTNSPGNGVFTVPPGEYYYEGSIATTGSSDTICAVRVNGGSWQSYGVEDDARTPVCSGNITVDGAGEVELAVYTAPATTLGRCHSAHSVLGYCVVGDFKLFGGSGGGSGGSGAASPEGYYYAQMRSTDYQHDYIGSRVWTALTRDNWVEIENTIGITGSTGGVFTVPAGDYSWKITDFASRYIGACSITVDGVVQTWGAISQNTFSCQGSFSLASDGSLAVAVYLDSAGYTGVCLSGADPGGYCAHGNLEIWETTSP